MLFAEHGGWLWPADDEHANRVVLRDCAEDVAFVMAHTPKERRQVAVQAGGNVGVYAHALSAHFRLTYTLEPDPTNYRAMCWNLDARRDAVLAALGRGLIARTQAALGDAPGQCAIQPVGRANCGAHRVVPAPVPDEGALPVVALDDLELPGCDLLWLDVEGSELPALRGAKRVIDRFGPVIVTEEKHLGDFYGYRDEEIAAFLAPLGYRQVARNRNDRLYTRTS